MLTLNQAKAMAKRLQASLAAQNKAISDVAALVLVAAQMGHSSWDQAAPLFDADPEDAVSFTRAIPILRSFDEAKAREFYCGFLGFKVDWEHRFEPGLPLYMQVSRAGLQLHLSEHHGDASPGSTIFVRMTGIEAFHQELIAREYRNSRPGIKHEDWGHILEVPDPFGNRIRFCQSPGERRNKS